jgi:hypothetical protein
MTEASLHGISDEAGIGAGAAGVHPEAGFACL